MTRWADDGFESGNAAVGAWTEVWADDGFESGNAAVGAWIEVCMVIDLTQRSVY
jgi:hypothetical protein